MKRIFPVLLFFQTLFFLEAQETVLFPEGLEYDPFYAVRITDSDDNSYVLSNAFYQSAEGEIKYFVWFRRGTERGVAEYPLDLFKIQSLSLTGNYEVPPDGFTPCEVELTSGDLFQGFLDTTGYFAGMDQDFGSFGRIYLNYNGITRVEFLHNGIYSRCPFCGAIFYNQLYETCPFDQTLLEWQNN